MLDADQHTSVGRAVLHRPRRLICAGVSTAYAVESTVRHASDLGYKVVVAADACSSATRERHESALNTMALIATISEVDAIMQSFGKEVPTPHSHPLACTRLGVP